MRRVKIESIILQQWLRTAQSNMNILRFVPILQRLLKNWNEAQNVHIKVRHVVPGIVKYLARARTYKTAIE